MLVLCWILKFENVCILDSKLCARQPKISRRHVVFKWKKVDFPDRKKLNFSKIMLQDSGGGGKVADAAKSILEEYYIFHFSIEL